MENNGYYRILVHSFYILFGLASYAYTLFSQRKDIRFIPISLSFFNLFVLTYV